MSIFVPVEPEPLGGEKLLKVSGFDRPEAMLHFVAAAERRVTTGG